MTAILTTRSLDSEVTYTNLNKKINMSNSVEEKMKKEVNFIKQKINEEVKPLPFYKKKKFLKTLVSTQVALLSILALTSPTLAATAEAVVTNASLMEELPSPEQVDEFTQWAISTVTKLGVAAGIIVAMLASTLYFHPDPNKVKKAMEMIGNAIKGITQILLIPTIVGIIIITAMYLLGDLPFFHLPF